MKNYIWKVTLQEHWDYEKTGVFSEKHEYTVISTIYEKAITKAEKVAKKKSFLDDDAEGDGLRHYVTETRLISISQEDEIDA